MQVEDTRVDIKGAILKVVMGIGEDGGVIKGVGIRVATNREATEAHQEIKEDGMAVHQVMDNHQTGKTFE